MDRTFLRPWDISTTLGVTTGRRDGMLAAGGISGMRVGKALRVPPTASAEWIAAQRARSQVEAAG